MTVLTKVSNAESLEGIRVISGTDDGNFSAFVALVIHESFPEPPQTVLTADEYPVLAAIWDNDEDAVYDNL